MVTRKTQYGWMALGGMLCLFAMILTFKLRDGNKAIAQAGPDPAGVTATSEKPKAPTPEETKNDLLVVKKKPKSDSEKKGDMEPVKDGKPLPPIGNALPEPSSPPPPPPTVPDAGFAGPKPKPSEIVPAAATTTGGILSSKKEKEPEKPKEASPPPTSGSSMPLLHVGGTGAASGPPPSPSAPSYLEAPKPEVKSPPPSGLESLPPPAVKKDSEVSQPGEPPLAPAPGPVQTYQVRDKSETLRDIAERTMGSAERWTELRRLNPDLKPDAALPAGTTVRLPGDACVPAEDAQAVRPLPSLRPKAAARPKALLPLTGTYPCNLDDHKRMTLPRALRDQLAGCDTVLVSPGPDQCLWLTNNAHLERLAQRLEQSPAREQDVRVFKRLYFAQTEKTPLGGGGRVAISERLAQFAGLHQEVVLVGIDDHFEIWDAARWRRYTQQKSAAAKSSAAADHE